MSSQQSKASAKMELNWLPILQRFQKARVLVIGDLVADHYIYGQTDRISREAPVLIVRHEHSEVKLGGGANVAANARALGARVSVIGVLGKDDMGQAMERQFKQLGIRLRAVKSSAIRTETKTRILAGGKNTTRQQMLRLDFSQLEKVSESVHAQLAETLSQEYRNSDVVIVSDYGAGVLGPTVKNALQSVMKANVPVCVDSRHDLFGFRGATVCKPNEPELSEFVGRPLHSHADLMEAGVEARKRLKCQTLLVTRGRNGMVLFEKGNRTRSIPVHGMLEAVDVTGAGDTVISALAVSLAAKANAWEASLISNIAGGLVVQKQGTATVTFDELTSELEKLQ